MKKILIVTNDLIPHVGGKSTHIIDLKQGLEENGNNVKNNTFGFCTFNNK